MKALKCLMVGVAVVGLLTLGAQAAHRPDVYQVTADPGAYWGDGTLQGDSGARALGNNCSDIADLGTLDPGLTLVPYSVGGFDDDFDEDTSCPAPCGYYTDDIDGIMAFQVSVSGLYEINACDDPNNNALQLRKDGTCPGDTCVESDDNSCDGWCGGASQAVMTDVQLDVGTQYYLIIEFGVGNLRISGPCTDSSQCQDGLFCNGEEVCDPSSGFCVPGIDPCAAYQTCDEVNDVCVNPDPCIVYSDWSDSGYFYRPGPMMPIGDDWFLDKGCTDSGLVYYEVTGFGHPALGCTAFNVDTELWANTTGKVCTGDWWTPCTTDADCVDPPGPGGICITDYCPSVPIANTACTFTGLPPGGWILYCEPTGPVPCPDSVAPEDGIPDCWVMYTFADDSPDPRGCSGPFISGGPAVIGFSDNLFAKGAYPYPMTSEHCTPFGLVWFGGWPPASFPGDMCCDPCGPCCDGTTFCEMTTEALCNDAGGTYGGNWLPYPYPDGNGVECGGSVEACCLPNNDCIMADTWCCVNIHGGIPQGAGTACTAPEACCFPDDTCLDVDPLCCDDLGGVAQGAGTVCMGWQACCIPNVTMGACIMADGACCGLVHGGVPMGMGSMCEGDADGDGVDGTCGDNCFQDPLKLDTLQCGCNMVLAEWMCGFNQECDTDTDGIADCCDECPDGVWDPDFVASNLSGNTCEPYAGCADAIPTVTEWGLVILALLLLVAGKVYFGRRRAMA